MDDGVLAVEQREQYLGHARPRERHAGERGQGGRVHELGQRDLAAVLEAHAPIAERNAARALEQALARPARPAAHRKRPDVLVEREPGLGPVPPQRAPAQARRCICAGGRAGATFEALHVIGHRWR